MKGYRNPRFWSHAPSVLTGSIHVQATEDANEQHVIRQVNQLFSSIGFTHFTTQLEKDEFVAHKSSSSDYEISGGGESDDNVGSKVLLENNPLEGFGSESVYSSGDIGLENVEIVNSSGTSNTKKVETNDVNKT